MGACCLAGWRNGFSAAAALTAAPASISDHRSGRCQSPTPPEYTSPICSQCRLILQVVEDFLAKEVKYVVTDKPDCLSVSRDTSSLRQCLSSVASPAVPEEARKRIQVCFLFCIFWSFCTKDSLNNRNRVRMPCLRRPNFNRLISV